MTNAEVFTKLFGLYATELWAKNEQEFLNWLNADYKATSELTVPLMPLCEWLAKPQPPCHAMYVNILLVMIVVENAKRQNFGII